MSNLSNEQGEEEEEGDYEDAYEDDNDVLDSAGEDEQEDQVGGTYWFPVFPTVTVCVVSAV